MPMYVGEFIGLVRKYFELNNSIRKNGHREDVIERRKIADQIEAALVEGIVVVTPIDDEPRSYLETDEEFNKRHGWNGDADDEEKE